MGGRYRTVFAGQLVLHIVGLFIEEVDRTNEHVVGDIIEVTTELQPRTCHGDMVCSTLAFGFDQQPESGQVSAFPGFEWFEFLQAVAVRSDDHIHTGTIFGRSYIAGVFHCKSHFR